MRVLIAFDKFKGALGAAEACAVVADVLRSERPGWELDLAPLADGGDGFCRILTAAAGGVLEQVPASGTLFSDAGPRVRKAVAIGWVELERLPARVRARLELGRSAGRLAVIELAACNGLAELPPAERDVWRSSTRGTGELIRSAAEGGADAVLLGVGGSATSDLGLGALSALGLRFENRSGVVLDPPLPCAWPDVARVTGRALTLPPLRIACDVQNPLLGPNGAAAVYGPQKGLSSEQLPHFEAEAERLARLLCEHAGQAAELLQLPGAGAAGGIAFGLAAAAGARLVAGFELVEEWLELAPRVQRADLVLSGEGRFDSTSLAGKGPGALAQRATRLGRRCAIFAGAVQLADSERQTLPSQLELVAISPAHLPLEQLLEATTDNLARAVQAWLLRP
ncbi:MAG: glycerate kinase [Deltaproteobacteria bacterium]